MNNMELLKLFMVCIYVSILFRNGLADDSTEFPDRKLMCICHGLVRKSHYFSSSNCSTSCNCTSGEVSGTDGSGWTCLCSSRAPSTQLSVHVESCFTSCNCTSGSIIASNTSLKQHISIKLVIALLLLCVVLAAIAISALLAYYFYCKDKSLPCSPTRFSENSKSWNSASNLLSQRIRSLSVYRAKKAAHLNFFSGFINRTCFSKSEGALFGTITHFSYIELEHATNKFSDDNLLGIGGSSKVYRGRMGDGRLIAIKRLNLLLDSHFDYEFLSEIEMTSRLHHRHVVPLLGYCFQQQGKYVERLLVFEYLPNGNLRDHLDASYGQEILEWETRVSIAHGVAKGLEYLHEAVVPRILHRDIKSTNILLDDEYRPKIADLGMAKQLSADGHMSCAGSPARMMGTFGYFAPECAIVGRASLKSDVFSFGVVLLELITGRQPLKKSSMNRDESLVLWAMPRLQDHKLMISDLPDPLLKGKFPKEEVQAMGHLAKECLQWDPECRPTMSEVVQILLTISSNKPKARIFSLQHFLASWESTEKGSDKANALSKLELQHPHTDAKDKDILDCTQGNITAVGCDVAVPSSQSMRELISWSSYSQSSLPPEDEIMIDLQEPRYESFTHKPMV